MYGYMSLLTLTWLNWKRKRKLYNYGWRGCELKSLNTYSAYHLCVHTTWPNLSEGFFINRHDKYWLLARVAMGIIYIKFKQENWDMQLLNTGNRCVTDLSWAWVDLNSLSFSFPLSPPPSFSFFLLLSSSTLLLFLHPSCLPLSCFLSTCEVFCQLSLYVVTQQATE